MSAHAFVWWAILAGAVVVLVLIVMQLLRALGEVKRIEARVEGYADLPVVRALDRADADMHRIDVASAALPALIERGKTAVATIRRGPLPPELMRAIALVRAEIVAFRTFSKR